MLVNSFAHGLTKALQIVRRGIAVLIMKLQCMGDICAPPT